MVAQRIEPLSCRRRDGQGGYTELHSVPKQVAKLDMQAAKQVGMQTSQTCSGTSILA